MHAIFDWGERGANGIAGGEYGWLHTKKGINNATKIQVRQGNSVTTYPVSSFYFQNSGKAIYFRQGNLFPARQLYFG